MSECKDGDESEYLTVDELIKIIEKVYKETLEEMEIERDIEIAKLECELDKLRIPRM